MSVNEELTRRLLGPFSLVEGTSAWSSWIFSLQHLQDLQTHPGESQRSPECTSETRFICEEPPGSSAPASGFLHAPLATVVSSGPFLLEEPEPGGPTRPLEGRNVENGPFMEITGVRREKRVLHLEHVETSPHVKIRAGVVVVG